MPDAEGQFEDAGGNRRRADTSRRVSPATRAAPGRVAILARLVNQSATTDCVQPRCGSEDLGPGDFVKVDCAACGHTALTPEQPSWAIAVRPGILYPG
jgi:hypothetical protein